MVQMNRRSFLKNLLSASPALALGPTLLQYSTPAHAGLFNQNLMDLGLLNEPDKNGIRLPAGFISNVIAISGEKVGTTDYEWHKSPDGGACFPTNEGGWIYVSNCEEWSPFCGGASAVEFNASGEIVEARKILSGTRFNCAGGATPWHTWLSCEEADRGSVYETDPYGKKEAVELPALGYFQHEAVAIDPERQVLYLTEDESDGCFYRFLPTNPLPDLSAGELQVAIVNNGLVSWKTLPDPTPAIWQTRTRNQVPEATKFRGGEGIWFENDHVFFTTKLDHRVWVLNVKSQELGILYDGKLGSDTTLRGVDNITSNNDGNLLIAEDGGDMQLVVLSPDGEAKPFLQIVDQDESEITGPAFSPDGSRLYFSSQRGHDEDSRLGITYEIRALV